mgnify:CR=1 FL=1
MNHSLKMILGCLLPLLLIFILPLFGVSQTISIWLFLILMFGLHLLMMRGHGGTERNHRHANHPKE